MGFWTKRRSRQFVALALTTVILVLTGALAVYADSIDRLRSEGASALAQGDATPTPTGPAQAGSGVEAAVLAGTEVATPTATTVPPTSTPTPMPGPVNVIVNGGFEEGFVEGQGVGVGWSRFQNGDVMAGWYDDTWFKVVYEGEHAQLMELRDARKPDRYVGIYQTASVVPNTEYVLTLHGLVRSDSGSPEESDYGFRMHYGIDYKGGTDWQSDDIEWVELMWDDQPREDPDGSNQYRMESYTTKITAQSDNLTLFIRGLKKWPDDVEGNYDIDGISLVGAQGTGGTQPQPGDHPTATPQPGMPETGDGSALLENSVLIIASAALILVLAGGAVWGLGRRRA